MSDILSLPPDELLQLKAKLITDRDKRKYAKEILSSLREGEAQLTIDWLRKHYNLAGS